MRPAANFEGYELASVFQPIYGVRDRRPVGYEALVRPTGPDGRSHPPRQLFTGLSVARTISLDWMCRSLHLHDFALLRAEGCLLHLNVHPVAAIEDAALAREGRSPMQLVGFPAARICLEIVEGACGEEAGLVEAIAAYRAAGFTIALDDFGVKRSNLDRVGRLRPDFVKIDRALMAVAMGDDRLRAALPALVASLQGMGTRVVVKGIESTYEAFQALEAGADYLQGNAFAVPQAVLADDAISGRLIAELARIHSKQAPARALATA